MIAQGTANGASGLLGGFVVAGSLSKSTVADLAGQKTQMASLINAGLIFLTMLFLAGLFETLPKCVLGAVVIDAAIGLIKFEELKHYRLNRRDFAAFLAAAIGLFFIGILAGILIGVILSLLMLIASASQSPVRRMALDTEHDVFVDADEHPDALTLPGIEVAEIHGPLFFADADNFRKSVMAIAETGRPHTIVIDLDMATTMDMDGAETLGKLARQLGKKEITLLLARVEPEEVELLRKIGVLEEVGPENIYKTVRDAVAAAGEGTDDTAIENNMAEVTD
jgi:MFS superfamily sulfate permease-like transporter